MISADDLNARCAWVLRRNTRYLLGMLAERERARRLN